MTVIVILPSFVTHCQHHRSIRLSFNLLESYSLRATISTMSYASRTNGAYFDNSKTMPGPYYYDAPPRRPNWDPRGWTRRTKIIAAVAAIILLIIIIVAAAVGSRNNRYPAYSKINYRLQDTCKQESAPWTVILLTSFRRRDLVLR